jgi:hypothetical protein
MKITQALMHSSTPLLPLFCFRAGEKFSAPRTITITVSTNQVVRDHVTGMHLFYLMQQTEGNLGFPLHLGGPSDETAETAYV